MNNGRHQNQNIAVLGAGLSGSAAALLLRSEGAQVTVLDSAEDKNLLAQLSGKEIYQDRPC